MEQNGNNGKTYSKEVLLEDENGEHFKMLNVDGTLFPMGLFKNESEARQRFSYVRNFPYKAGDVLLCSYPKTGTHWTGNIVHFLMYDGPLNEMESHAPCLIDFFDIEGEKQREGRRIITSHFEPKHLPTNHFENGGKTILVFRNPKDTVVSMFYMMQKQKVIGDFKISWDSFFSYWLKGEVPIGSYFEYYNSWEQEIEKKPNMDVLIVQYEDLKRDCLNEVRRIQKYIGVSHSDERLEAVIDRCSLDNLKTDVESGKVESRLIDDKGKSALYRKGIIGDWKNLFTVAQNEKFETTVIEKMKNCMFKYKAWN